MDDLNVLYKHSIDWALDKAQNSATIALGFHSVVDGMVRFEPNGVEYEMSSIDIPKDLNSTPTSIKTKEDFFRGLAFSFVNGKALQIMIDSKEVYNWIMKKFGSGKPQLGGTSANMAKTLSQFPFPKILVYVYPLTQELIDLFPNSDNLFTIHENEIKHLKDIEAEKGIKAIHWIFEFFQGQKIKIKGKEYTCPRSNRFIASWNPVNSRLEIKEPFRSYVINHAEEISRFLVSGFHIMRENYPNGESVRERMKDLKKFMEDMRRENPRLFFHLEFASIRRDGVRKSVERILFPISDSLGTNEVELSWIAQDLSLKANPVQIQKGDVNEITKVLLSLREMGLKRVHFHTLGFYLLGFDEDFYDVGEEKNALAFAALAAAQRARDGHLNTERIKEILRIPTSNLDYREWKSDKTHFILLPTKVIKNQKISVGLGDTISSLGFALG